MFQWMPYFRNHTVSGYDEQGNLTGDMWNANANNNYAYQAAMCPSITCMISPYDKSPMFDYAKKMNGIWREAAQYMLDGDYYPLLPCSKSREGWYSVQFHCDEYDSGIIQGIRHIKSSEENKIVMPKCFSDKKTYIFSNHESGKEREITGKEINQKGFAFKLDKASGEVWFYKFKNGE